MRKSISPIVAALLGSLLVSAGAYCQTVSSSPPELKVQTGHSWWVESVTFSPDGKYALSGSVDNTLKLLDVASGKELRTFTGHSDKVFSVTFSPDGKYALSGSQDKSIKLWDLGSGKELRTYNGHTGWVYSVAFSPDGKYALSGSGDRTLRLWDIASGKELRFFSGHSKEVYSVCFSPDGKYALSGSADATIRLWDISTGKALRIFIGHSEEVRSVAFSPDGKYALSGSGKRYAGAGAHDNSLKLWDINNGKELKTFTGHAKVVNSVAFSPDGKYALSGSDDNTVKLWDIADGRVIKTFTGHPRMVYSVAYSPDGKYALSGSFDKSIKLWDIARGKELWTHGGQTNKVNSVASSPDGKYALTGSADNSLKLWDIANGRELKTFIGHSAPIYSVAFSPDEKLALSGSSDYTLKLWDIASGQELRTFTGHFGMVNSVAFSPDGRYALSGSADATIRLWDISTGKALRIFIGHSEEVHSVAFSPDGKYALSGSSDYTLKLWDIASGKEMRTFIGHSASVTSVAFSPDGKYALSGSCEDPHSGDRGTLKLWDIATGKEVRTFAGHLYKVSSVSFSQDGKHALSGSWDNTLKIWDIANGRELATLTGHSDWILSIAVVPNGKYALSCSNDSTMKPWNIATCECIYTALASADGAEWLVFTPDGYWDGSPNCGVLIAMARGFEVWNIDQFAVRNNRPDIILQRLGNAEAGLVDHYRAQYEKRLRRLGLSEADLTQDYRVPSAAITSAKQNDKFLDIALSFKAAGKALRRYQIFVNDVPLFGSLGKTISGDAASATERIELSAGDNKVEVSCMDASGAESFRVPQYFSWDGKTSPNLYFLAFGVSAYHDPSIRSLRYPAKDARDLESAFKAMEGKGFNKVFTRVYTDAQVTKTSIAQAKDFLKTACPDDTLVLFISGHGIQIGGGLQSTASTQNGKGLAVTGTSSPKSSGSTYYYVTADAKLSDIPGTAADFDTIEELLQGVGPRQKLFLMDTCESGEADAQSPRIAVASSGTKGLFARTLAPESTRGLAVLPKAVAQAAVEKDRYIYNDLVRRSGAIVFSSCRGNEASLEADEWRQGAFTAKILSAFKDPSADANGDGRISADELRNYVASEVPKFVKALDPAAEQHPTVDRDNIYEKFSFPTLGPSAKAVGTQGAAAVPAVPEKELDTRAPFDDVYWGKTDDGWFRFALYQESRDSSGVYSPPHKVPVASRLVIDLRKVSGDPSLMFGYVAEGAEGGKYKLKINDAGQYEVSRVSYDWSSQVIASGKIEAKAVGTAISTVLEWTDSGLTFTIDGERVCVEGTPLIKGAVRLMEYNAYLYKAQGPLSEGKIEVRLRLSN